MLKYNIRELITLNVFISVEINLLDSVVYQHYSYC